jgi:hypothetical protein
MRFWCGRPFLANDLVGQLDALVTDKDAWPGDELPDLVTAFPAKGALLLDLSGHAANISL